MASFFQSRNKGIAKEDLKMAWTYGIPTTVLAGAYAWMVKDWADPMISLSKSSSAHTASFAIAVAAAVFAFLVTVLAFTRAYNYNQSQSKDDEKVPYFAKEYLPFCGAAA